MAMPGMRRMTWTVALSLAIAGCSIWRDKQPCGSEQEYQTAESVPPISVPQGLDQLDPSARMNVPDDPKPAEPLSQNAECLQWPPGYFEKPLKGPSN